jgi:small subunit ribosomal protein S14
MAKKSMVEREVKRQKLVDRNTPPSVLLSKKSSMTSPSRWKSVFAHRLKLADLPRNSSATRLHNRCQLTGRPHAYYRKLKVSRIMLRELGSNGQIPGMVKSSW